MRSDQIQLEQRLVETLRERYEWRTAEIAGFISACRLFGALRPDCPTWLVTLAAAVVDCGNGVLREDINRELITIISIIGRSNKFRETAKHGPAPVGEGDNPNDDDTDGL